MPNYFSLTRKGSDKPEQLTKIDEEICALLGQPIHPVNYCAWWFDVIGLPLAMGRSLADLKERFAKGEREGDKEIYLKIVEYLDEHYTTDAWARIGNPR